MNRNNVNILSSENPNNVVSLTVKRNFLLASRYWEFKAICVRTLPLSEHPNNTNVLVFCITSSRKGIPATVSQNMCFMHDVASADFAFVLHTYLDATYPGRLIQHYSPDASIHAPHTSILWISFF